MNGIAFSQVAFCSRIAKSLAANAKLLICSMHIQSQVGFEPFKSEIWMKGPKKNIEYNEDQRESNGNSFSICVQRMWNSRELKKTAIKRAGEASSN